MKEENPKHSVLCFAKLYGFRYEKTSKISLDVTPLAANEEVSGDDFQILATISSQKTVPDHIQTSINSSDMDVESYRNLVDIADFQVNSKFDVRRLPNGKYKIGFENIYFKDGKIHIEENAYNQTPGLLLRTNQDKKLIIASDMKLFELLLKKQTCENKISIHIV